MGKGIALLVALAAACAPAGCIANFECTGDGCPEPPGDGGVDADGGVPETSAGRESGGDAGGDTGANEGGGLTCTAPPKVLACHEMCVDPTSDTSNCGGCGVKCNGPASMHGAATCTLAAAEGAEGGADASSPVCGLSCATGYHACGGDCLSDADSPSDTADPCVLDDSFGTFVAPAASGGSDTGSGKKASPYATLGYALAHARGGRVYVCNATYSEQVTIGAAIGLYGGLACPGSDAGSGAWSYVGGHATIAGPSNSVALTISAASGAVEIDDVAVTAPSALGQDPSGNGNSSVAVLVSGQASVTFKRCALTAGAGANALTNKPAVPSNYSNGPTAPGGSANNGTTGGAGGATTGANACASGSSSTGGAGGTLGANGNLGNPGTSSPAATLGATTGYDGKGGGAGAVGDTGASGSAGNGGLAATTYGKLSSTAWIPNPGNGGAAGDPGQGGGGGGAKTAPQAGGTGGGSGGCGGAGGFGGAGGGASIALASSGGTVTLDAASTLSTGTGGNGQPGGDGQAGQAGGPSSGAVPGGAGGNGAGGSGGAGGTGGISVCIVYQGTAPSSAAMCTSGTAGQPGAGGSGISGGDNADGNPGATGNQGAGGLAGTATSPLQLQ